MTNDTELTRTLLEVLADDDETRRRMAFVARNWNGTGEPACDQAEAEERVRLNACNAVTGFANARRFARASLTR